jgi:hypothetical protein
MRITRHNDLALFVPYAFACHEVSGCKETGPLPGTLLQLGFGSGACATFSGNSLQLAAEALLAQQL